MIDTIQNNIIKPYSLSRRLDIVVKYLYALNLLDKLPDFIDIDATELYHKHIHIRTGSIEPGSEHIKSNINDYFQHFNHLLVSLARGFDPRWPIPISPINQLPLNGAHRLAASLALEQLPVLTYDDSNIGGTWDMDWFADNGFNKSEIHNLVKGFSYLQKYNGVNVAILWDPVNALWDDIEADLSKDFNIILKEKIALLPPGFNEFIRDVYSYDYGPVIGENIENKVKILSNNRPRCRVLFMEKKSSRTIKEIKSEVRLKHHKMNPLDLFSTIHISDSSSEYIHLEKLILNELNMKILNTRTVMDSNFISNLENYRQQIINFNININHCCVVGSSILNALNLRKADDIDFTLLESIRMHHFDKGVTHIDSLTDVVTFNYPRSFSLKNSAITDQQLILQPKHHFYIRGLKFASPYIVLERKQHQRREKDFRDIKLLGAFLRNNL